MSESSQEDNNREELLGLTSEIVAAHVSNNTVAVSDLPDLIERVYKSLASVGAEQEPRADRPVPAVPAKQSVTPDYIICLEDGKKLKMLKRHLKTAYNLNAGRVPGALGLAAGLSDGVAELRETAQQVGEGNRFGDAVSARARLIPSRRVIPSQNLFNSDGS